MDLKKLHEPFLPSLVSWRIGATNGDKTKGIALAYIDARDVMDRLDSVCGPENWQAEYPFAGCCRIGIYAPIVIGHDGDSLVYDRMWVWKSNGAGETNVEGEKGQFSDAFKRAAVLWGIGRYLYDLDSPWVEIEQKGKSYSIKKTEMKKLTAVLENVVRFAPGEKDEIVAQVRDLLSKGDDHGLKQIFGQYESTEEKTKVWALFTSQERSAITEMMK